MTKAQKGDIIKSINGRDRGRPLFVLEVEDEYLLLVDGKRRKIEQPKRKKRKHCMFIKHGDCRTAEKIKAENKVLNSEIRKAIAAFKAEQNADLHIEAETEPSKEAGKSRKE